MQEGLVLAYQRVLQLGWNRKVAERRPQVAGLIKALRNVKKRSRE